MSRKRHKHEFYRFEEAIEDLLRSERGREWLLRQVGIPPAAKILIIGDNMPLELTAGGSPLSVQLVPLPAGERICVTGKPRTDRR